MNTDTPNEDSPSLTSATKPITKFLGQPGVSALSLILLLVAAILDSALWVQWAVVLILVVLTHLFVAGVRKLVSAPNEDPAIQKLIEDAEAQKSKLEHLVNIIAKYWPRFALLMAIIATAVSTGNEFNLSAACVVFASTLLLTNTSALTLTIPVGISSVLRVAADNGIFIRSREAFEKAAKLDLLLFTKGAVITETPREVNATHLAHNSVIKDEKKLLSLAASLESVSQHALASAITNSASNANLKITKPKDFKEFAGFGVEGVVGGKQVILGSPALLIHRNIRMEVQELIYADEATKNGYSIVCVVVDGHLEALLRFADTIKPLADQAVYMVAKERIRVGLLTGDSAQTAQTKADQVNISEVYAELSPERKAAFISSEQEKNSKVGLIAEAPKDAAVLATADLSIALVGESKELEQPFDVLVTGNNAEMAAEVISLSARLRKKILIGLGIGFGYSLGSLIVFVSIVSPLQVPTPPALAALIGSLSVLVVTINAYSLGKLK